MFDDAISLISFIWSSINTWFTPTFLFLFLNLMIGTIFLTSSFNSSPKPHPNQPDSTANYQPQQPPSPLMRAPSLLQRLKSINFTSYPTHAAAAAGQPQQQQQHNNLSSTSDPSQPQLGPSRKAEKSPARVKAQARAQTQTQTHALAELGLEKVSAQLMTQSQTRAQVQTQTRDLAELGLEKVSAQLMTQSQTRAQVQTQTRDLAELGLERVSAQLMTQTQTRAQVQVLQRQTQTHQSRAPVIEEEITLDDEGPTLDEIYSRIKGTAPHHHHNRHNSDTVPANGEIPMKLPAKMKKYASEKSAFNHFEADMTTENSDNLTEAAMEEITAAMAATAGGGTEVDAMADDFINRFKKDLQLQRIESNVRYKDMITRGSEQ